MNAISNVFEDLRDRSSKTRVMAPGLAKLAMIQLVSEISATSIVLFKRVQERVRIILAKDHGQFWY